MLLNLQITFNLSYPEMGYIFQIYAIFYPNFGKIVKVWSTRSSTISYIDINNNHPERFYFIGKQMICYTYKIYLRCLILCQLNCYEIWAVVALMEKERKKIKEKRNQRISS